MIHLRDLHHRQPDNDKPKIFARGRVKDLPHSTIDGIQIPRRDVMGIIKLEIQRIILSKNHSIAGRLIVTGDEVHDAITRRRLLNRPLSKCQGAFPKSYGARINRLGSSQRRGRTQCQGQEKRRSRFHKCCPWLRRVDPHKP